MHSPSDSERSSSSGDSDRVGPMAGMRDGLNGLEASPDGTERMDGWAVADVERHGISSARTVAEWLAPEDGTISPVGRLHGKTGAIRRSLRQESTNELSERIQRRAVGPMGVG